MEVGKGIENNKDILQDVQRSNVSNYQDKVFELLNNNKKTTNDNYQKLQYKIEELTMYYDEEKTLHHLSPDLIKILVKDNDEKDNVEYINPENKKKERMPPSAKEYIKYHCSRLHSKDMDLINNLPHYTLEVIIVYTLASIFNCVHSNKPAARVASLIEQLDTVTREQGKLIHSRINPNTWGVPQAISQLRNKDEENKSTMNDMTGGIKGKKQKGKVKSQDNLSSKTDKLNNKKAEENGEGEKTQFMIGGLLVEYMLWKKIICVSDNLGFQKTSVEPKIRKGKYYVPKNLYAICNFDLTLLPIRLNLPMVCPPRNWDVIDKVKEKRGTPKTITDLSGGYLSKPISDFYFIKRFNLLSSRNLDNFNINLNDQYKKLLSGINYLQKQPFEINSDVLNYLLSNENEKELVEKGILMPRFLATINIVKACEILRSAYFNENEIDIKSINYSEVLSEFLSRIQKARYEDFIIRLAKAYSGYRFYLPAFLDFRGRIYRSGILHFHERDLARSLIVFPRDHPRSLRSKIITDNDDKEMGKIVLDKVVTAAAFHFKKFNSYNEGKKWFYDFYSQNFENSDIINSYIIAERSKGAYDLDKIIDDFYRHGGLIINEFAKNASEPFQFISKVLSIRNRIRKDGEKEKYVGKESVSIYQLPITQDASASAYQLISYLLLNHDIAIHTNLIPNLYFDDDNKEIKHINQMMDIYLYFKEKLLDYLKTILSSDIYRVINEGIDRKLIKSIFMPLVYGKSKFSISQDIFTKFNGILNYKEAQLVATHINTFFKLKFENIHNLMSLIRDVAWISAAQNKPVYYTTKYYTTVQDYMTSKSVKIFIYDRIHKKRRQVTLRIPKQDRDRRKTNSAVFANFIHQMDANIALLMIMDMKENNIPIYTVHDNFITSGYNSILLPDLYLHNIMKLDPLSYINSFILLNLSLHPYQPPTQNLNPINMDELADLLRGHKPADLNPKYHKLWDQKIDSILQSYNYYVNSISTNKDGYNDYCERWTEFKCYINFWDKCTIKYCLHL